MAEEIRAPIVTILGHVDHGKTSLLDYIRKSNVVSKEHGGITQHIGAYQVIHNDKLITFIDTPGHAAFEKMRSRGAKVADIAVLVVAVDDGIMPQTVEAIKHIQESKSAMIVVINKIDLPNIDFKVQMERIKKQLSDRGILIEEYGGEIPIVSLSAKTGEGVDKLLETILLVAELNELKGDSSIAPTGVVIESSMDKFKGCLATLLIRNGTLKKGDQILIGGIKGKIKGMLDSAGKNVELADPSMPVEILGLEGVPAVGSVLGSEVADQVSQAVKSLVEKLKEGESKTLKVIIKADKQGSLEAIEASLEKFNKGSITIQVISSGVSDISESDVKMAAVTHAIVVGFNVKVASIASKLAENEGVLIRTYNIIYELLEELEEVIEGMVKPGQIEESLGKAEIIAEFPFGKGERIAGSRVLEGVIAKGSRVRVIREGEIIGESKIKSLRKVKEEVQKVEKGSDCGIIFDPPLDFQIGDMVESFRVI